MKRRRRMVTILLLLCLTVLLISCESATEQNIVTEDVMIKNAEGTYTRAQIILPDHWQQKKLPLVSLSHGFHGTMNSAGGKYLAVYLAQHGIATIRMDFSHYKEADPKAEQTCQYTVDTMVADQVLCIDYMISHYQIDEARIGLFGRSLGGRAAMVCANESAGGYHYQALVLVAPAGNRTAFQRYMGGQKAWEQYKKTAEEEGSVEHQGVVLTPAFFRSIESYVPSERGNQFHASVLVIYNTEDHVVLPSASLECAKAYEQVKTIEITSAESPHGYEMGFTDSEIKDMLFSEIGAFYLKHL